MSELSHDQKLGLHKPKAKWTPDEDAILVKVVEEKGPANWNSLAESLPGRTGKQCRERWLCKLSPDFKNGGWTIEEDNLLIELQGRFGNRWSKIRKHIPQRSSVSIKNRWVSLRRKGIHQQRDQVYDDYQDGYFVDSPIDALPFDEFDSQLSLENMFLNWM